MELPEFDKKKAGIILGALALILAAALLLNYSQPTKIKAHFESSPVTPGTQTNLIVEVTNILGEDVNTATLTVTPVSPADVLLSQETRNITNMGRDEWRKFEFPINVSPDAVDGTYSVNIEVTLDGETESTRAFLEVRS